MGSGQTVAALVVWAPGNAQIGFAAGNAKWPTERRGTPGTARREAQVSLCGGRKIVRLDIVAALHKE